MKSRTFTRWAIAENGSELEDLWGQKLDLGFEPYTTRQEARKECSRAYPCKVKPVKLRITVEIVR
jgi:hypothetical protein